jgi:DnaJ-class molecular chaperone
MSDILVEKSSCHTCNGAGFVWRGRMMQHTTCKLRHGMPIVNVYVSRLKDLCPECHGTGTTLAREIQRTPWALALRL